MMRKVAGAGGLAAAVGAGGLAYGFLESRLYRTRAYVVPVLPPDAREISILQVSDLHLRLSNQRLIRFLDSLAKEQYDLVLATGDLLGHPNAVEECLRLLNGLDARMGRYFVFGSSDYYSPVLKSYFDYFLGRRTHGTRRNPIRRFREGLIVAGWRDLTNTSISVELDDIRTQVVGMDDPWLHRDDRSVLVRDDDAEFAMVVVHDPAPYRDAADAGFDLVIAGHTHGGQVRVPFYGAVVTNSTVPRRLARGLSRVGESWLFVTPGLGTGKFAPFRFLCRPEASLLHLRPREA
jgi:predicted MPP superfamily phosphohydrolase